MNTLDKVKKILLRQQKEVEREIEDLEKDDPVNSLSLAESSEPGTDSWVADTHSRVLAVKENLKGALKNIKKSLQALNSGSYGKCENCSKPIESARLDAIPTANLCIACSKKVKKTR